MKFYDAYNTEWEWDDEGAWLDVVYEPGDDIPEDSGYLALGLADVFEIMLDGLWFQQDDLPPTPLVGPNAEVERWYWEVFGDEDIHDFRDAGGLVWFWSPEAGYLHGADGTVRKVENLAEVVRTLLLQGRLQR
jgi:hypothetical protein